MGSTTVFSIGLLALIAVLTVLVAAAESGVTAISRARIRNGHQNGLAALLRRYIRRRQRVLRNLSIGSTLAIVAWTAVLTYAISEGERVTAVTMLTAGVLAALSVTFLRQSVRAIVLVDPERWGLRLARPIRVFELALQPVAWLVTLPIRLVLRLVGRGEPEDTDPREELAALIAIEPDEDAAIDEERRMMRGILEMSDQTVRELMTPRTDLTAVSIEASVGDVMKLITDSGFSRIPLYEESLDRIIGVIYAKDLLAFLQTGDIKPTLRAIARPPYFVPETKRANELLADMRRDQVHMAVAVDEYGGTAGVVTVEDLLEEIVGEISDEYDVDEVDVQRIAEDEAIVDARLTIDELNEIFGTDLHSDDFDTVGGLVVTRLGRLAVPGDEVTASADEDDDDDADLLSLRVLSILGRRIKKVRVARVRPSGGPDGDGVSPAVAQEARSEG